MLQMASVGLDCYKWHQSQTLGDVQVRRLSPEVGGGHAAACQQRRWAPKGGGLGGLTLIGEENKCQRGHWVSKRGVDWGVSH